MNVPLLQPSDFYVSLDAQRVVVHLRREPNVVAVLEIKDGGFSIACGLVEWCQVLDTPATACYFIELLRLGCGGPEKAPVVLFERADKILPRCQQIVLEDAQ